MLLFACALGIALTLTLVCSAFATPYPRLLIRSPLPPYDPLAIHTHWYTYHFPIGSGNTPGGLQGSGKNGLGYRFFGCELRQARGGGPSRRGGDGDADGLLARFRRRRGGLGDGWLLGE